MTPISDRIIRIHNWAIYRRREIIFAAIMFFVASISFGLGYLASQNLRRAPIIIEKHLEGGGVETQYIR